MNEGRETPIPISPDVVVPDETTPTPIRQGVAIEPKDKSRRNLLVKAAQMFGVLAGTGLVIGSQTETGQKIVNASPLVPHSTPNGRPDVHQQLTEVNKNIDSHANSGKGPENYTSETLAAMERVKAENAALKKSTATPYPNNNPHKLK